MTENQRRQPTRRRRRRKNRLIGLLICVAFLGGIFYFVYDAASKPDGLLATFRRQNENAPERAEAAEPGDTTPIFNPTADPPNEPENPFASFTYYIPEKLTEYESYQKEHAILSADEVVWQVNAGLNRPFFTDPAVITHSNPLLVNPYNRLPEDFAPLALVAVDDSGRTVTPETKEAFDQMRAGAIADGFDIAVQSAYRTIAYQQNLYDRAGGDGSVARPGFSEHHTGRAIDLWGPGGLLDEDAPTDTGRWVAAHAHEYGFIVRYTEENQAVTGYIPEPWHLTYVGKAIAQAMHDSGIKSLEEYTAKNPTAALP